MASARRIKQYYFTAKDIMSWKENKVISENSTINSYYLITQVGIQGLPGLKFHLGNMRDNLYLNGLGYFDLDLEGTGAYISSIVIDRETAQARAANNPKGYLIIDLVLSPAELVEEEV